MAESKIIVQSKPSPEYQLPGVVIMPDAKSAVRMGSGTITSLISSGGMAIIYEIWNPELEVKRAIKLLHPDHTKESEDRFQTEIKITAKLHHPNIVEIYAVGKWNDLPYIEMERIDGLTLEKLIVDTGGLPVEVCTAVAIMTGRALNYAHNQEYQIYGKEYHGIIHRDLKPGNIMVTNAGIVKLMDFGIAKPMTASTRTMEGVVMGTMQYLAPEQLDGKDVDVRADIYSLGTVLYEMLTGARAFPEQNLGKLVTDKLNNNYVPLENFSRKIPPPLCALVHKCLRYEKEKRIQNALDFLRALGHVHKSLSDKSPEQILSQYMKETSHGKTVISIKKNSRMLPLQRSIAAITAVCLITAGGIAAWRHFKAFSVTPAPAPRVAEKVALAAPALAAPTDIVAPQNPPLAAHIDSSRPAGADSTEGNTIKDVFEQHPKGKHDNGAAHAKEARRMLAVSDSHKKKRDRATVSEAARHAVQANPVATEVQSPPHEPVIAAAGPEKKTSVLERLKQQYKTSDLLQIFSGEVEAGRYQDALIVFEKIDKNDADTKKAKIYKLRALKGMGDKAAETKLLLSADLYDGEFYLEKARYFSDMHDGAKTQELLRKASVTPCGFLEPKVFRQNLLYEIALCASAVYDKSASDDTKKKAMEAWFEVKSLFRNSPEHGYYKTADSEIRRISKAQ